jgi:L-fuconolactonase
METSAVKIDSHQHFWRYNAEEYPWIQGELAHCQRDLLPEHLIPLLAESGFLGSIAVQARQILEETDFLLDLANQNSSILGVVGWVPLVADDVEKSIEMYARHEKMVGFRHVIQDETDDQFILRKDFQAGVRVLERYDLCYDILIFEKHLVPTIAFVDQFPNMRLVLDHIAKPKIRVGTFDHEWAKNIRELAKRPHVTCKLSGMMTEVSGGSGSIEVLQPYFDTVLEAFGPDRLMFGSDWPVCLMRISHRDWVKTVENLISSCSADEQAAIMGGTAQRVYLGQD